LESLLVSFTTISPFFLLSGVLPPENAKGVNFFARLPLHRVIFMLLYDTRVRPLVNPGLKRAVKRFYKKKTPPLHYTR